MCSTETNGEISLRELFPVLTGVMEVGAFVSDVEEIGKWTVYCSDASASKGNV